MTSPDRHLAHFNWATLVDEMGSPRVAGFVNAIERVNDLAERSDGFVWRSGNEAVETQSIDWPLFHDPRVIASFSVWQSPENLKAFVYKTVHGAFYRRKEEWFEPGAGPSYVLWWIPAGHIPTISEARDRVERMRANGATAEAFDFTWLETLVVK
ncbi:MAG: DUF3291 domain-containing protein [Rhodobacteraceae bacterium]|nr:DUF3291 domain-containing protein [Paracoccaceae bacterium]